MPVTRFEKGCLYDPRPPYACKIAEVAQDVADLEANTRIINGKLFLAAVVRSPSLKAQFQTQKDTNQAQLDGKRAERDIYLAAPCENCPLTPYLTSK